VLVWRVGYVPSPGTMKNTSIPDIMMNVTSPPSYLHDNERKEKSRQWASQIALCGGEICSLANIRRIRVACSVTRPSAFRARKLINGGSDDVRLSIRDIVDVMSTATTAEARTRSRQESRGRMVEGSTRRRRATNGQSKREEGVAMGSRDAKLRHPPLLYLATLRP
jgi:hypothetical protein